MSGAKHWDTVYATRAAESVGWYVEHLSQSLQWIADLNLAPEDRIVDVGGGASTLVDDLLTLGHRELWVLDISYQAIELKRHRLGNACNDVTWIQGDVTEVRLPSNGFRLWHDRALFHFLTDVEDQKRYRAHVLDALVPGGFLMVSTFSPQAPPRCSGLPVQRHSVASLVDAFEGMELIREAESLHVTPSGVDQPYIHALFRRVR